MKSVSVRGSDSTENERERDPQGLQHLRNKSAILHGPAVHPDKESERSIEFWDLTVSCVQNPQTALTELHQLNEVKVKKSRKVIIQESFL